MNKTRGQTLYEEAKGRICATMEETAEEMRRHAAELGLNREETEAYLEECYKLMAITSIAMLRVTSILLLADDDIESFTLWNEACDRLEREFIIP